MSAAFTVRTGFAVLLLSALAAGTASAQEKKGGFFEKDFVNKGMISSPPEGEKEEAAPEGEDAAVEAEGESAPESQDSWSVDKKSGAASQPSLGNAFERAPQKQQPQKKDDLSPQPRVPDAAKSPTKSPLPGTDKSSELSPASSEAVLSLVVSAEPEGHLVQMLDRLARVRKQKPVRIGEVVVVGSNQNLDYFDFAASMKEDQEEDGETVEGGEGIARELDNRAGSFVPRTLRELGMTKHKSGFVDNVLTHLNVETSPVWVVRYKGADHVFEGNYDPSELFDEKGYFVGEKIETVTEKS